MGTFVMAVACADGPRLSSEEFIDRANAICRSDFRQIGNALDAAFSARERDQKGKLSGAANAFADAVSGEASQLDQIRPPRNLETRFDEMVEALKSAVEELHEDPNSIFPENKSSLDRASELANEIGLENCA